MRARLGNVWVPVGIALAAIASQLPHVGRPSLWSDEVATISASTRTPGQLLEMVRHVDVVHFVYYLFMHAWISVFGISATSLRLPSVLAIGVAAAGIYVVGRQFGSRDIGLVASVLFVLLPRVTWMATEARSFALMTAIGVWLTVLLVSASRSTRWRWWILYGFTAVLGTFVFLDSALLVMAHGLVLVCWRTPGRIVARWALAAAGAGACCLPLVLIAVSQSSRVGAISEIDLGTPRLIILDQWFLEHGLTAGIGWLLALVAFLVVVRNSRQTAPTKSSDRQLVVLSALWLAVPTALLALYSFVEPSIYQSRALAFSAPALALLAAFGLVGLVTMIAGAVSGSKLIVPGLLVTALVGVAIVSRPGYSFARLPYEHDNDWPVVASYLDRHKRPGDAIVFALHRDDVSQRTSLLPVAYPQQLSGIDDMTMVKRATETGWIFDGREDIGDVSGRLVDVDRVWFVFANSMPPAGRLTDLRFILGAGFEQRSETRLSHTTIVLLIRQGTA